MAELLILNKDNRTGDAALDKARYRRGDVVCVMPDGHKWGSKEGLPDFVVVRLVGVPVGKVRDVLEPEVSKIVEADGMPQMLARRKVRLAIPDLPAKQRQDLQDGKTLEVTETAIRNAMKA